MVGVAIGITRGLVFATQDGAAFRGRLARRLRTLRTLAAEKAGDLGALVVDATFSEADSPLLTGGRHGRRLSGPGKEDKSVV